MAKAEKTRNSGQWTEARYTSFIKSALRGASWKWGPIQECLRNARVKRGWYKCACCGETVPSTLPPPEGKKRRIKNAIVDHIEPVIDPAVGFTTWDSFISRLFCEIDGFQVLCNKCHLEKTQEERDIATKRRADEKL